MKERRPEDGEAREEGLDKRGEDNQAVDFERKAREEVGRDVSYKDCMSPPCDQMQKQNF